MPKQILTCSLSRRDPLFSPHRLQAIGRVALVAACTETPVVPSVSIDVRPALRGTEGVGSDDLWKADIGNIVGNGLALKQIVDLYNEMLGEPLDFYADHSRHQNHVGPYGPSPSLSAN